jgi:hypothetical protein
MSSRFARLRADRAAGRIPKQNAIEFVRSNLARALDSPLAVLNNFIHLTISP